MESKISKKKNVRNVCTVTKRNQVTKLYNRKRNKLCKAFSTDLFKRFGHYVSHTSLSEAELLMKSSGSGASLFKN